MYVIDLCCGEVCLTYRRVGLTREHNPPQVVIVGPADGARFTPEADIHFTANVTVTPPPDPDFAGELATVEFFANGQSIGVGRDGGEDRKSTRLNSSHLGISYAVFCLKK